MYSKVFPPMVDLYYSAPACEWSLDQFKMKLLDMAESHGEWGVGRVVLRTSEAPMLDGIAVVCACGVFVDQETIDTPYALGKQWVAETVDGGQTFELRQAAFPDDWDAT